MKTLVQYSLILLSFLFFHTFIFAQENTDSLKMEEKADTSSFNFHHEVFLAGYFLSHTDWQEGGNDDLSFVGNYKARLDYQSKRFDMSHEFLTKYGYQKLQGKYFIKHADDFSLDSKYDWNYGKNAAISFSTLLQSQYAPTFDVMIDSTGGLQKEFRSSFLTPAYISLSLGWAYKPTDWLRLNFGLASSQLTYIREKNKLIGDDENPFGEPDWQYGFTFEFDFNQEIGENLFWENRSNVYMDYANLQVTLNMQNRLSFIINPFLKFSMNTDVLFIPVVNHKLQLKNELLVGVFF